MLFAAYAATLGLGAAPGERYSPREVHYLMSAESVVSDGDLDLRDEYATSAWRRFTRVPPRPTAALSRGRLVEPQGIGFPLLIAPAYALGGATAVELFLAAVTALAFVLAAALARRLVPEPWASAAALVAGLSPPALAAATAVSPEPAGAALLAAAALGALAVRDRPRLGLAFAAAAPVAVLPWLALELAAGGAVCALAIARWVGRRARWWIALLALDSVLSSGVAYLTLNDGLYGGLTPYAPATAPGGPTGASSVGEALERAPRLLGLLADRDAGLLRWAPFMALALYAVWLLWRSRRERLAAAVPGQRDVEVAAGFIAAICGVQLVVAAFLAPSLHGTWGPARLLVPVMPLAAALCAWGLRFAPRTGSVLAALTLAGSAWLLIGLRVGSGGLAPLRGDVPWGGAQDVLPRFTGGALGAGEAVLLAAAVAGIAALLVREWRAWRGLPAG